MLWNLSFGTGNKTIARQIQCTRLLSSRAFFGASDFPHARSNADLLPRRFSGIIHPCSELFQANDLHVANCHGRRTNMSRAAPRVALLAEDLYEDPELWYPYYRLLEAGAQVRIVGPEAKTYTSKHGYPVTAEVAASAVSPADFDGVVVPGGFAPDRLRRDVAVLDLVRGVFEKGGVIAAIC